MSYTAEQILKKANTAFSDRDANRSIYDDCYELLSPHRNNLTRTGGTQPTPTRQYDSTGQISAANFVNTIQREFTPPFTRWAKLVAGDALPEEKREEINEQLEKITDLLFSYINASNFSTASAEMYWEWGVGTGCLWLHEGTAEQPFNFVCSPISQIGLLEGKFGTVDCRFRRHTLKGNLIQPTWLKSKVPADIEKDKDYSVTEAFMYDYEMLLWKYCVVIDESKEIIFEEWHKEEICFTPRWLKIAGRAYGVGVFTMALADVKTLNILKQFLLETAALDLGGVYTVANDGGVNLNNITIQPNTFIPVERNGGAMGATIQRLDTGGNFQLQEYLAVGLQDQIKKTMLDNKMPAETAQPKTAFEIAQRIKDNQIDIGSAYGRAMNEYIVPMLRRCIDILVRRGILVLPDYFKTIDNLFIKVQITSAIAQVQKADDLNRFVQGFQMSMGINPQLALTAYEVEKLPRWINEMVGAPSRLMRSEAEQEQLQKTVAQVIAQQQVAQQQGQA